jgi:ferredoxin-NADP reductase
LRHEIDAIAGHRRARVHYVVDEPAGYSSPLTAQGLHSLIPDLAAHDVYLCGPPGMTQAATEALRDAGVPSRRIHHESFAF